MEYLLRRLNDDDLTYGLEERVTSLKARIKEMKIKIGELDPSGRKEPKLDLNKSPAPAPEKSDLMDLKAKLMGRK